MGKYAVLDGIDYGRDLNAKIPGAPNFEYGEFVSSETAVKYGIANVPTEEEWKNIEAYAVNIAQPLREKCGRIKISSGFRCEKLNSHPKVGGSKTSHHRHGKAGDLEPMDCSLMELLEAAAQLPYAELIAEYFDKDGWVHTAYDDGFKAGYIKIKDANHDYDRVSLDYIKQIYG